MQGAPAGAPGKRPAPHPPPAAAPAAPPTSWRLHTSPAPRLARPPSQPLRRRAPARPLPRPRLLRQAALQSRALPQTPRSPARHTCSIVYQHYCLDGNVPDGPAGMQWRKVCGCSHDNGWSRNMYVADPSSRVQGNSTCPAGTGRAHRLLQAARQGQMRPRATVTGQPRQRNAVLHPACPPALRSRQPRPTQCLHMACCMLQKVQRAYQEKAME